MKVELLSHYGDDTMAANCARVSFGKEASNYTDKQNERLIKYLAEHNHKAPFFHPQLQFRIKCPIYVERQLFKHTAGISVNSISGRYVDFSDSYTLIPMDEWRLQSKDSKQGSEGFAEYDVQLMCDFYQTKIKKLCREAYEVMNKFNICKEQSRTILPLNLNTEFIWTGSLYALINMCHLRLKADAQKETRDVVQAMLDAVKSLEGEPFKNSLKAFGL